MIYILAETTSDIPRATTIAARLKLPTCAPDIVPEPHTFLLRVNEKHLSLQWYDETGHLTKPFYPDFSSETVLHRACHPHIQGETLVRAIGLKGNQSLSVIDATAGLGRDAFILACAGAQVTMCERSPILALLLESALAQHDDNHHAIALNFIQDNAITHLKKLSAQPEQAPPDVVYCDPMFPTRTKSALVKKEMRALRDLVGPDEDTDALLSAGLKAAQRYLVVKRPPQAEVIVIDGQTPSNSWQGKRCRFDRYSSHHRVSATRPL